MDKVNRLGLAVAATAVLAAASAPGAYAGSGLNGPRLPGMALESLVSHGPAITPVSLIPSGEEVVPNGDKNDGSEPPALARESKPDPNGKPSFMDRLRSQMFKRQRPGGGPAP
jgi:hypothetical protein